MTILSDSIQVATPFLKWAGGKRWFVSKYPNVIPKSFRRYIEPFLGSGAVFFHIAPAEAHLSDLNAELINAFNVVKSDWKSLQVEIAKHHKRHCKEHYYKVRSQEKLRDIASAARFIYLNRTCWNGLYRVNRNGKFNVPKGSKSNVLLASDDFELISKRLTSASIKASDFEASIDKAAEGDFVFVDPPYTVKHNLNGFVKYNDKIFSWDDQIRLSRSLLRAKKRGVQIVMTNANHESVRCLYKGFKLRVIPRITSLSADAVGRGETSELLITA